MNRLRHFPYVWLVLVVAATLSMFMLLGWHVWNTFRVSHDLKAEYSQGIARASRILSTHQRLVHEAHLIVFDGKPEKVDAYRRIDGELLHYFADAYPGPGGDPVFGGLLESMERVNQRLRQEEHQALNALAQGDAFAAQELLHRQSNRDLAWSLEAKVAEYIEGLDQVFSDRLDAESRKELISLLVAFAIFVLSVAIWVLLIQRLRSWGRALEDEMAQRIQAEEQLRRAQKMEALGQLAAGVSHDFNNILTVIQGFVDVARRRSTKGDAADVALEKIEIAARQGTDLTRSLLTFSGRAGTEMGPVDLGNLVTETVELLKETLPASVRVRVDFKLPVGGGWIWGNQAQLQQVLVNLVLNARDAMPIGGGSLVIAVERLSGETESTCTGSLRLSVTDTGEGMSENVRERIFEPFFTSKPRGRGTGLGLAVVASVVTEHGGHISIDSTPGKGTRVAVDLPTIRSADAPKRSGNGTDIKVLFALNDSYASDLLLSALTGAGFQACSVDSGSKLTVTMRADDWDLLLIDSGLSSCGDEKFIEVLESQIPSSRVVVIGQDVPDVFEKRLGPKVLVLNKPFLITELMRLITSLTSSHGTAESPNPRSR